MPSAGFTIVFMCAKAQGPVGQGGHSKFEGVLFRSDSRHNVCLTVCVGLPGLPPSGH